MRIGSLVGREGCEFGGLGSLGVGSVDVPRLGVKFRLKANINNTLILSSGQTAVEGKQYVPEGKHSRPSV